MACSDYRASDDRVKHVPEILVATFPGQNSGFSLIAKRFTAKMALELRPRRGTYALPPLPRPRRPGPHRDGPRARLRCPRATAASAVQGPALLASAWGRP